MNGVLLAQRPSRLASLIRTARRGDTERVVNVRTQSGRRGDSANENATPNSQCVCVRECVCVCVGGGSTGTQLLSDAQLCTQARLFTEFVFFLQEVFVYVSH